MSTLHDARVWDMPYPLFGIDMCPVSYPVALGLTTRESKVEIIFFLSHRNSEAIVHTCRKKLE